MMRRFFIITIIFLSILYISCPKKEKNGIDITTQQTLQGEKIPLRITHISPSGLVEGELETFKILVGFNQAMIPLRAIPRDETEGPLEFNPPIKGKYRWLGSRTLTFIPSDTLQPATEFTVTLRKDKIQSLTGMRLEKDTTWKFESIRPTLISSKPYQGSNHIEPQSPIYLYFNLEMAPNRIGDRIKIFANYGQPSYVYCGQKEPKNGPYKEEIPFSIRQLQDNEKKDWPLKDWDNNKTLVLVPMRSLPQEALIEVYIYPGLLAKTGNLGTNLERILSFNTYNYLSILNYTEQIPGGYPLSLCFSNPVTCSEIIKNISFSPPLDSIPEHYKQKTYPESRIYLYLPFRLNSTYLVKISKNLKDKFGNTLDKDYEFTLKVGDYIPFAEIPVGINIVEKHSDLRFPATFINVDSVYLEMGLVSLEQAIPFLNEKRIFNYYERFNSPGLFNISKLWQVDSYKKYRNQRIRFPIELKEALAEKKAGLVFIQFDNFGKYGDNSSYRYLKAFCEVNDLGVTWKYSPENNLVWITSLNNSAPVANALVQFRNDKNQILTQGYTDAKGFAELPGWAELRMSQEQQTYEYESEYEMESYTSYYEPEFWITVSKGEDVAVYSNRWNFGIDPWRFDISYAWSIRSEEYCCYIFTEKGVYKNGETAHIKGILRKKRRGELILPDLAKVNFIVKNSRDETIINDTISVNQYGSFFRDVYIPDDAPTGYYSIYVYLPKKDYNFYHSFRVEAYRPAEFEVKTFAERDTFIAGDQFKGWVEGRYLFGMPMVNADIEWVLYKDYYYFSLPKYKGYSFSAGYDYDIRGVLGSGRGKLNNHGKLSVVTKLQFRDIKMPSIITLEGTVVAPNKQTLSGRQNWLVFPANLLIGIKSTKYLYTMNEPVELSLITIKPSGEKVGNKKIELKFVKAEWKSIKKARLGGRYEWVSEYAETEIKKEQVISRLDSTVVKFNPDKPGYYYVEAVAKDEKGRQSFNKAYFYVAGRGYAGWQMRDDDIIELVADKDIYQIGDTARILVKSPYDSANALITVERELILRKSTKKLRGNADYIEIPIKAIDLPNVYVCVMLLRGRVEDLSWDEEKQEDLGKPQFKIGYVNLKVDAKEKHLVLKTHSDKLEYRPRDSVTVFYEVKDYLNRPVKNCELSLFVVDLGVLNLIAFKTPEPFDYFYGTRPLAVKTIESRLNILGERSYGEKGEERGGGGAGEGIPYREKFISTVYYKGDLKTDETGKGKVKFVLPDNLTKFRIMLVAQTKNSEFGSAESTFVVNLPFIVSGSIPRFCRIGDKFSAGVVLHNRTNTENNAVVECNIEGLKIVGENRKSVVLGPNTSKEVLFDFIAEKTGNGVFKFNANMGGEKDALKLSIPVKSPPFIEAVATFSSTTDSTLEGIIVPENIYENTGGLEISLSSSILAGMKQGIEHLLDYPYGCLEQRLSRILPLIVGEDIINQFKLAPVTGKELRDSVQKVLDEVLQYQTYTGGFLYFKESCCPCPYLSAYTMFVLKRAHNAGYRIDQKVVEKGKEFLNNILRWEDVDWTYPYNDYAKLTTRAFCLYSLAIWGEMGEAGYANKLFERREQISVFGKALLLKAGRIFGLGNRFENELVRSITNKIKLSPTTAHFEEDELRGWTFPSPAKVTGFVIQTFTELDIDFPYKDQTIKWLVQERSKKTMPSTHENAFVFDAFQTYYKKYEKEEPDFVARIVLGEKEILKEVFKGRTNETPRRFLFSLDNIQKNKLLPIMISKQGIGRLYYTLRMSYAYKENPIAFDEGFYLWKEIFTLDGKPVNKFKRGEVYKIVLHIVVPETRIFAVVEDPLPAGFEPVQTSFATESRALQEQYWEEQYQKKRDWWGSFDYEEQHDDKMLFFAQELFPGEHTQVYFVRAGTGGRFLAPSAKAEEMYAPEVFGSTTQGFVVVE
uniref:Alpha-2-macroglobulin family protein n=1 Tax=candidate division WOR-3 bacterium TaxID=2052148 RepID=A0A7V0Z5Y7_UNCW3